MLTNFLKSTLVVFFIVCAFSIAGKEALSDNESERRRAELNKLVSIQRSFISKVFKVTFSDAVPSRFGYPKGMKPRQARFQDAWYVPTKGIYLNPVYEYMIFDKHFRKTLIPAFRHELGHELTDQISRRIGLGGLKNRGLMPELFSRDSDKWLGKIILEEGIGRVFERYGTKATNNCDFDNYIPGKSVYVPNSKADLAWKDRILFLLAMADSGYCVAKPVIDRMGARKGIEYLLTHPLVFPDWNLRQAIEKYLHAAAHEPLR